jgi:hypothetical protein
LKKEEIIKFVLYMSVMFREYLSTMPYRSVEVKIHVFLGAFTTISCKNAPVIFTVSDFVCNSWKTNEQNFVKLNIE